MTSPHEYESFLVQEARRRNVKADSSLQTKLAVCYAALYAITMQLFTQNLANISAGFLKTIEADIRYINRFLLNLNQSSEALDFLSARRYLDEAYGQIVVALQYYQTPKEEPDNYKRLSDRTKALREARANLSNCLQQWNS